MQIVIAGAVFTLAAACAAVMGFAIQRGGTCTVAAVDEVVSRRGCSRLVGLLEAALWVGGGLVVASAWHLPAAPPAGYPVTALTMLGGALLGLGALVNGACVFGAVARLGSGEWAYAVTPVGFYVGCVSLDRFAAVPAPHPLAQGSPVLDASAWLVLPFAALALWRLARALPAPGAADGAVGVVGRVRAVLVERIWSPRAATSLIGVSFLLMLLLVGAWSYTDVIADLARGMAGSLGLRLALLLALFLGALAGGRAGGRLRRAPLSPAQAGRCFAGGTMMGWGTLLIPGGNDGLILVGMPLLWPYAWVAFLTMCIAIGTVQFVGARLFPPPRVAAGDEA